MYGRKLMKIGKIMENGCSAPLPKTPPEINLPHTQPWIHICCFILLATSPCSWVHFIYFINLHIIVSDKNNF